MTGTERGCISSGSRSLLAIQWQWGRGELTCQVWGHWLTFRFALLSTAVDPENGARTPGKREDVARWWLLWGQRGQMSECFQPERIQSGPSSKVFHGTHLLLQDNLFQGLWLLPERICVEGISILWSNISQGKYCPQSVSMKHEK